MTRTVVPGLALMLAALSTLGPFSIDTFLPAMGAIGTALEASPLEMQQALSVYLFFYGGMMLWHGSISDAMGRRPVLMVATGLFACASIGCMLAQSLGQLLLFRALQGVCGGAGLIVGRAIIRDTFDGHDAQRLMSQVTMLFSLSPALAPVIGGWLYGAFGWRSIFAFMALVGLVLFVLCWPLAILALIAWPFVWLLSLPFRLVGITISAVFEFLRALLYLPARLLGARPA